MKFILFILISAFFLSCKKDKVPTLVSDTPTSGGTPVKQTIDPSLLPYLFDSGSYWIYSNGLLTDTIQLTNVVKEDVLLAPQQPKVETFLLNFESSASTNYTERFIGAIITRFWTSDGWVFSTNLDPGQSYGGLTFMGTIDTLQISAQTFSNIKQFKINQGNYFSSDMYLYYCDSVGVVRKEVLSGNSVIETWDLIEFSSTMYPF